MTKYYHCAFVKHENNDKPYLYDEVALDALISHAKSLGIEVDWV